MEKLLRLRELSDPDRHVIEKAYARWAPLYDALWTDFRDRPARRRGRRPRGGGRILEVGVGTGLSFSDYDHTTEVIGIDLSEPMVAKAQARLASGQYPHVKSVMVMDAENLAFPDGAFDCVVAQFVITLVADAERVLSECARVVRPGGEIIWWIISIRRRASPPRSSAGARSPRGRSGCGRNSRSPASPHGRATTAVRS